MNILLAGPDCLFREGVRQILEHAAPEAHVVCAENSVETVEPATEAALDLVVLDLDTSGNDIVAAISELKARFETTPIVALSWSEDRRQVERALDAGAAGYVLKSSSAPVLLSAIRLVLAGGTYLPPSLLKQPVESGGSVDLSRLESLQRRNGAGLKEPCLTPRQLEVLALVAKGEPNKAIARHLGIADSTVKIHMHGIFEALEVRSRSQAAIVASRLNRVLNAQIQAALQGETKIAHLLASMHKRRFRRNELLFRKGDPSREIYYVSSGTVHLEEIGADLQAGSLFGEIGLFSPNSERTCSASCKTDCEIYVIPAEKALQIYCQDPEFAVYVTHLIAERLLADKARMAMA